MWRTAVTSLRSGRLSGFGMASSQMCRFCSSTTLQDEGLQQNWNQSHDLGPKDGEVPQKRPVGWNIAKREKISFLVKTLSDIDDAKEVVYGTLDSWVAWEQNFPIAAIKNVLLILEKEQQWHRVVQVIKWMLSKGQGNTMGTYKQLIRALDMDHRGEEAHQIWVKKIGHDLHPVPWQLCSLMISVYYRNKMLEDLVKLFKSLEAYGRKPPEKSIVQKVANAYEMLGLVDEKERVLEKYGDILSQTRKEEEKKKESRKKTKSKKKAPSSLSDFYNWNRIKICYYDGASFSGDNEDKGLVIQQSQWFQDKENCVRCERS